MNPVEKPTTNPQPAVSPQSPGSSLRKKRMIIIASVVGGILLAILAAGGVAYAWWNNPQKALDDSVTSNTIPTAVKVNMSVKQSSGPNVTIDLDTKIADKKSLSTVSGKVEAGAISINLKGGVAVDDSKNVYFKVEDIRKTINGVAGENGAMIEQFYGGLLDKVDNKWVKMTQNDLKDISKDSGVDVACMQDALISTANDRVFAEEATKLYKENKYLSVKETLGNEMINGRDSKHLVLNLDQRAFTAYNTAIEKTDVFKKLKSCVKDFGDSAKNAEASKLDNAKYELWVDTWSHRTTKLSVTGESPASLTAQNGATKQTVTMTLIPSYDKQTIIMPNADTQFSELKAEIEKLQQSSGSSFSSSSPAIFETESL